MCQITNRAFERNSVEASIQYSFFRNPEKRRDAKMFNAGEGGLYFESNQKIPPGTDIIIEVPKKEENRTVAYRGEVRWCQKKTNGKGFIYGVGVRFLRNVCDYCGQVIEYHNICKTEDYFILCPSCFNHKKSWAVDTVGTILERYYCGNVI